MALQEVIFILAKHKTNNPDGCPDSCFCHEVDNLIREMSLTEEEYNKITTLQEIEEAFHSEQDFLDDYLNR